ncbi:hypothetical protein [Halegenticoccus tardaugens]|uniref:hypothetical protein n=1 Tax=Halegenticoccus tardaugens TaxID=2071624 RepID=UPI00100BC9DB|nr:hypothetical protein [Halegenticoccus tardaugens]
MTGKDMQPHLTSQNERMEPSESRSKTLSEPSLSTGANTYELTCVECSHTEIATGFKPALEASKDHEEEYENGHFVKLELIES